MLLGSFYFTKSVEHRLEIDTSGLHTGPVFLDGGKRATKQGLSQGVGVIAISKLEIEGCHIVHGILEDRRGPAECLRNGSFLSDAGFAKDLGVRGRNLGEGGRDAERDNLALPLLAVVDQALHDVAEVSLDVDDIVAL